MATYAVRFERARPAEDDADWHEALSNVISHLGWSTAEHPGGPWRMPNIDDAIALRKHIRRAIDDAGEAHRVLLAPLTQIEF